MAGYDSAEITDRERLAADRQKEISNQLAKDVRNQLAHQMANYNMADAQNKRLANVQLKQNSRKSEADRFEAQRQLQNATIGLLGSMNQAMNGSAVGNLMRMLENRSDADNQTYWTQLQANQDAIRNAYNESINQNRIARTDAAINAEKALRDLEADLSANLNNINPNLYIKPGTGEASYASNVTYDKNKAKQNNAALSGYLMPDRSVERIRKPIGGVGQRNAIERNDYFGNLINRFNGVM